MKRYSVRDSHGNFWGSEFAVEDSEGDFYLADSEIEYKSECHASIQAIIDARDMLTAGHLSEAMSILMVRIKEFNNWPDESFPSQSHDELYTDLGGEG